MKKRINKIYLSNENGKNIISVLGTSNIFQKGYLDVNMHSVEDVQNMLEKTGKPFKIIISEISPPIFPNQALQLSGDKTPTTELGVIF